MTPTAFVFDAYGTLLDVSAAARRAAAEPGFSALQIPSARTASFPI